MLINAEPYGRLGNRLFLGAHLIGFSEFYQVPVLNLAFAEYATMFPWMSENAGLAYPWAVTGDAKAAARLRRRHQFLARLPWSRRFSYWGTKDYVFDGPIAFPRLEDLRAGRSVYLSSWLFRGFRAVSRYRETIRQVFRFSPELVSEALGWVEEQRRGVDWIVGVHVRWEDYRGTRHFLDQSAFQSRMETFAKKHPERRIRFLLFSNESLPSSGWGGLDVCFSPGRTPDFDLEAMAHCHYLMAPPSTFSGWASFYGGVPLLTLSQHDTGVSLDGFHVVEG